MSRLGYFAIRAFLYVAFALGMILCTVAFIIFLCMPESPDLMRSLALFLGTGCTGLLLCVNAAFLDKKYPR